MSKRPLHNVILTNEGKQYHGSPCANCGATLRWVANRCCVACLRDFNAANAKRWRKNKALRNVPDVK